MSEVKRLTITDCSPIKRKDGAYIEGSNAAGPWRLHSVLAVDETGLPIQYELKSFQQLPLGVNDIQVEKDSKGDGFILSLPRGSRAQRPVPADDAHEMLRESVRMLAERVAALEDFARGQGWFASTPSQTDIPAVVQPVGVGAAKTDDIPF